MVLSSGIKDVRKCISKNHLNQREFSQCSIIISDQELISVSGQPGSSSAPAFNIHMFLLPGVLDSPLISLLFWILICFSIMALFTKRYGVRPLLVALILRSIYYLGIGLTLNILGALNVSLPRAGGSGGCPAFPELSKPHSLPFLAAPS